jgi:NAD dependent epimerase/dehydratase family enzyme
MQTEATLALTSCRAAPKHFLDSGFEFEFPELPRALANIYPSH